MGKIEVKIRLYHMHTVKIIAQMAFIEQSEFFNNWGKNQFCSNHKKIIGNKNAHLKIFNGK